MTETSEPWAAFYHTPPLPPGELVRWQREEAALRAEEQSKESERQERADARQEHAMWEARQYSLARGLPWDPQRPFANVPDVYQRADATFAMQDREAHARDLAAAREAGLVHLLHQGVASPPSPGDAPPTSRSGARPSASGAARANPVAAKVRQAFTRWATRSSGHRSTRCGCLACTGEDVHRADAAAGLPPREITRTFYEGARIR